jgi:hypothetical protein
VTLAFGRLEARGVRGVVWMLDHKIGGFRDAADRHGNETCCSARGYELAAQVRLFDTGHNRKTDAVDAHSLAMAA